jgi:hypothetical protein
VTSNNRRIATLAARFGVTNGPWLFYGKAGGGWVGNDDFTVTNLTTGASTTVSVADAVARAMSIKVSPFARRSPDVDARWSPRP